MLPYGRQSISKEDIQAVVKVLESDFLTQGPAVSAFEDAVAKRVNARFAVASNSATSALHLACLALGLGPGQSLWTSPISFVASANCARLCGADVDFVDIDPETFCMDTQALADKLQRHKTQGLAMPSVVVPVHLAGQSCDMASIHALGQQYGFKILEDASHAIGASYNNQPLGDTRFSDICVFSFHPVKIITTGEGGLATTNNDQLAKRMARLRTHGITREPSDMTEASHGPWYYQMLDLGMNYRLTDLQAALGVSQLQRLEEFVQARRAQVEIYNDAFNGCSDLKLQKLPSYTRSSHHLFIVTVPTAQHSNVFAALRHDGIGVNLHYIPIHLQPYYQGLGFRKGQFPKAETYYEQAISLPLFPGLTPSDQERVVSSLFKALGH
ncbi:MAG: UDP-4-amino-4,6-dideoxy-N-acetyl-beta-L-altrosamine transaminase [Bordetella sp.]|jgi:UDP-4-amino-4,6-dideoxy-N-acetyl-beta-L-altrosamine transaminase